MQYSTIKKINTMDNTLISKKHKELMEDLDLVMKYLDFDDWEEMITSIKRDIKIKELLQIGH